MIRAWTENFSDIIIKASIFAIDYFVKYLEFPKVSILGCLNFLTMSESTKQIYAGRLIVVGKKFNILCSLF